MKYLKSKPVIIVLLLLAAGGTLYLIFGKKKKDKKKYKQTTVQTMNLVQSRTASGSVNPQNRLEIKSPVSGRVEEIFVKEGQRVGKGKILLYMSSLERAALLDAARAKSPDELAEWKELYKPTPVIAPITGLVIARNIEPGQTVTQQEALVVLSDKLIVRALVDETDISLIKKGQKAEITLDAYASDSVAAKVDHIAYEAKTVNNVTVYEVEILPVKVPEYMRSGMTATVRFIVAEKKNALVVPSDALINHDDKFAVRVKTQTDKPEIREVETGMSENGMTEITNGLSEGETVLSEIFESKKARKKDGSSASPFSPPTRRGR